MSKYEIYSPEGLRCDGRRWNELRQMKFELNTHSKASDGSSIVSMGLGKVVCMIHGPREPSLRSRQKDSATLVVEVAMAPFAGPNRDKHGSTDKRLQEMGRIIEQTFSSAILCHLFPKTEIIINLTIIARDGAILPCLVNATTLALIDAGIPIFEYVSACSVAIYDQSPLLDANEVESSDLPVVSFAILGNQDKFLMLNAENRVGIDRIEPALQVGLEGCQLIRQILDKQVRTKDA